MDKSTHNLLVTDARQKLPGILRTGCLVSQSLVADPIIPSHLKEDVLRVGSREKIVVSAKEVFEAYPGFVAKWTSLIDAVALDGIEDSDIDLGVDVTVLDDKRGGPIHKTMNALFRQFLSMQGKEYGKARLTTDHSGVCIAPAQDEVNLNSVIQTHFSSICRDASTDVLAASSDACILSRIHQRSSTTAARITSVWADVSMVNVEMTRTWYRSHHVLVVLATKANANAKKESTLAGRRVYSFERLTVTRPALSELITLVTTAAPFKFMFAREHSVHKCAEVQCLHTCLMKGCKNTCGEKDHFHGQGAESRTFASESGMTPVTYFGERVAAVTHLCAGSHACPESCQIDGICEQKVHLKKSARTYAGARGTFEYIYQEMNGCKKQCAHVLPSGDKDHAGCDHSCLAQSASGEDGEQIMVHYCDVRCPSCNYYCSKHFGHMGLHATSHGNMRQTYFMAKTNDIDIEGRKYQVGERGIAEMCNLFCSKMGRGHTHYLPCESKGGEKCVYTADASEDHRRHCVDELFPPPGRDMDELLHAQFWSTIGWEDPCNDEERAEFAKCRFQCNAPEHDGSDGTPSFCVLGAWHKAELKPEGGDDGFSYVDGHKFECVHAVDTGKFHNIFVLDSSGSMSGQPWQDLLCACSEFGISRLKDGGEDDLVSYVTFDHESVIFCEGERLPDALQMTVPFSGGGTSFVEGLRAANEVLSRNDFDEFKAVMIFFSDGQPQDIELGIAMAQHIRSTYAKYDLKAFVVGFGYVNLSVLQRVASEMGGEYRQVLDANALRTEFQRIAAVLCNNEASLALVESDMEAS
ncbi:hypothetical protein PR001_g11919 [Phytophthora rubi]|uniref:VWFA domain-containing protein n=3 Tax=Phytophthora TaxID=4783 RepID=A0A6A3M421_9STRA|nr:hypothetical protein PR002_g11245 [Phytophthora rubi]KAE9027645.1 hypothetical protein PR001_g11919 [Phytophthora rubi]